MKNLKEEEKSIILNILPLEKSSKLIKKFKKEENENLLSLMGLINQITKEKIIKTKNSILELSTKNKKKIKI